MACLRHMHVGPPTKNLYPHAVYRQTKPMPRSSPATRALVFLCPGRFALQGSPAEALGSAADDLGSAGPTPLPQPNADGDNG
jgi:hypothetical protein